MTSARNSYFLYTSQHALPPIPGKMERNCTWCGNIGKNGSAETSARHDRIFSNHKGL